MSISDLLNDYTEKESGLIKNFIRYKRIGEGYLLTTDHGTWVYLNEEKFLQYKNDQLDDETLKDLIDRGIYLINENAEAIVERYADRISQKSQGAGLHIIVPTIRCNLRCIYCHSEAQSITEGAEYDMTEETLKKTLDFIFQSPNDNITIEYQGGEPLQNKYIVRRTIELSEEVNKIYKKKFTIALVSNLLNLDEEFLDFLVEHKDILTVTASLDGPKYVHDKNRKYVNSNVGTYDQVVEKLKMCRNKGFNVGLLMVTTRYSLPYWKEIIQEYLKWGINYIQIKPLDYLGYACDVWDEIGYTVYEFVDFWKKCVDYTFELLGEGKVIMDRRLDFALDCLLHDKDTSFLDWTNPCGLLRGQIVYNYNGDIYCCDEARVMPDSILGNVYVDDYNSVVNKLESQQWMESSYLEGYYCDSCAYKPYCGICPVLHYAQEDNFRIKLNKTNRCHINRAIIDNAFENIIFNGDKLRRMFIGIKLKQALGTKSN